MVTLHIITVGKDKDRWVSDQIDHYVKLIGRYAKVSITVVAESKYGKKADISRALADEAERIGKRLRGDYMVALDSSGTSLTTEQFAAALAHLQTSGHSAIDFIIGGPYGLSPELKETAVLQGRLFSLSSLTLSHQIARVVLLEQLYRVLNLNAGGTYHK